MISKNFFDSYNGKDAYIYTLSKNNLTVGITDFGAAIYSIKVKTPKGEVDVCLGYPKILEYIKSETHCGATVGRVANRIGGAKFILCGKLFKLCANEKNNQLHGGKEGFSSRFWDAEICGEVLKLRLLSKDGDQGYPANLQAMVEYEIVGDTLEIRFFGTADGDTVWAPTNHAYFNLNGENSGDILGTKLKINAQKFTLLNGEHISTGEVAFVKNTPFDFTSFKAIGADICANDEQLTLSFGYDCNYVLNGAEGNIANPAAIAIGEKTGVCLLVYTDMPGLQFYTGNFLNGEGKSGNYLPRQGFCLEPQFFPNAVNIQNFSFPLLKKGETKQYNICYEFKVKND